MKKEGYSRPELFGTMKHYDANGNKIGESRPGFFGSMNNYDATMARKTERGNMERYLVKRLFISMRRKK